MLKRKLQKIALRIHISALILILLNGLMDLASGYSLEATISYYLKLIIPATGLVLSFYYLKPNKVKHFYFLIYPFLGLLLLLGLIFRGTVWAIILSIILFPFMPEDKEFEGNGLIISEHFQGFMAPCCSYEVKERKLLVLEHTYGIWNVDGDGPIDFKSLKVEEQEAGFLIHFSPESDPSTLHTYQYAKSQRSWKEPFQKVRQTKQALATEDSPPLHKVLSGSGQPTVIFESGLGTPLNNWDRIVAGISDQYQTLAYDRRGIGVSPDTEEPRTIENLVKDLRGLIQESQIEGPIVLVGHSLGGHIVRKYQALYPDQVLGLFLIDPTNEYLYDEVFKAMPAEAADSMKAAWDQNFKHQDLGIYREWQEAYAIDDHMRSYPLPENIPVTILASYQQNAFLTPTNAQIKERLLADWAYGKDNVKILNTSNSGHYIHLGEPEWVVEELKRFLNKLN